MGRRGKLDKKEGALKVYLAVGRHLLKTDDLHFGYWTDDLEVDLHNLPRAQEKHSELIISHIPEGTRTILDVGCGVGRMASRLTALGYEVDGVSPSAFLAAEARRLVGEGFRIFECRIEDVETDRRYDLVLFSESFQYVRVEEALSKCLGLLTDGGHLLICDHFLMDVKDENPFHSVPRLTRFYEIIAGVPFERVEDVDITAETSPTIDLSDRTYRNVFRPMWEYALARFGNAHPVLYKLIRWKFRKKIERLEWKRFSGAMSGESFKKFMSYRLMLYRKAAAPAAMRRHRTQADATR